MPADHVLTIYPGLSHQQLHAECSCGWAGHEWANSSDVLDEWENHCDVVFMEATGGY